MATTALASGVFGSNAHAQSTAAQIEEQDIVVVGTRSGMGGLIKAEEAPKSRSTISAEFLDRQSPGQSVLESINILPGVNFTNNDAYGSSGGNLRIRGFDGNRVSLTFDGMPLNDTGNYAVYSNQQLDEELIERVNVNLGTTDVDSPTASATGGTVNYVSKVPLEEFGLYTAGAVGENNYGRVFLKLDTGALNSSGLRAWLSTSYQKYDQWRGPGELEKKQYNAKLYQPLGDGDFLSLAAHWNENRNSSYRSATLAQYNQFGRSWSNIGTCVRDAPTAGVADNDGAGNSQNLNANDPASCTNFEGLRINPSNTGNIRGQSLFSLKDNLRLTIDPSFQYVLANGGGTANISERDGRLIGSSTAAGRDLNGDGDTLDTVRLYQPSNTNTHRLGVLSSLIWDVTESQRLQFSYAYDYGRHRQTGEFGFLTASGDPEDVWGGKPNVGGRRVTTADGSFLRNRDRFSIAALNQVSLAYRGYFLDEALRVNLGVRAPFFERELNQYCYTQVNSSNVQCSTQNTFDADNDGLVTLGGTSGLEYLRPYKDTVTYEEILPNLGISYRFFDVHSVYASYAEGASLPRTDNLYSFQVSAVAPETTQSIDVGYRYQAEKIIGSIVAWTTTFENRIVSSYDEEAGYSIDRNVGAVDQWGIDAEIGFLPTEALTLYFSGSYNTSELQENVRTGATTSLATKGKELVETPEYTFATSAEYEVGPFDFGITAKYTGERWATDVNDLKVDSYVVVDADLKISFEQQGLPNSSLKIVGKNILDEDYLGSISSTNTAAGNPSFQIGSPRTLTLQLVHIF